MDKSQIILDETEEEKEEVSLYSLDEVTLKGMLTALNKTIQELRRNQVELAKFLSRKNLTEEQKTLFTELHQKVTNQIADLRVKKKQVKDVLNPKPKTEKQYKNRGKGRRNKR